MVCSFVPDDSATPEAFEGSRLSFVPSIPQQINFKTFAKSVIWVAAGAKPLFLLRRSDLSFVLALLAMSLLTVHAAGLDNAAGIAELAHGVAH